MRTSRGMAKQWRVAVALSSILSGFTAIGDEAPVDVLALDFGATATTFQARSRLVIEARGRDGDESGELEARLFRGSPREVLKNHRAVVIRNERCIIFQSTKWPIRYASGSKLDLGWVPPAGEWTLVFHKGQWASNLIPIKEADVNEYFRRAFVFTVQSERAEERPTERGRHRPAIIATFANWFKGGVSERAIVVYAVASPTPIGESELERCFYISTTDRRLLRARLEKCGRCNAITGGASAGR